MDQMSLWLSPLLLLPGVGLLVQSTAQRFARLHEELHHLSVHNFAGAKDIAGPLYKRALLFRNAMSALYSSIAFLALAGLPGGIADYFQLKIEIPIILFACLAIILLFYSSILLIRESRLSITIIREHASRFEDS